MLCLLWFLMIRRQLRRQLFFLLVQLNPKRLCQLTRLIRRWLLLLMLILLQLCLHVWLHVWHHQARLRLHMWCWLQLHLGKHIERRLQRGRLLQRL